MPSRRRKRPAAAVSGPSSPAPAPALSSPTPSRRHCNAAPSASPSAAHRPLDPDPDLDSEPDPPRFYNTTFTTYRVSPLYVGAGQEALTPARLRALAWRLRDTLVGDVVRGVQVGLEYDAAFGRTGALKCVDILWVDADRILGTANTTKSRWRGGSLELGTGNSDGDNDGPAHRGERRALYLELRYETALFSALLLPSKVLEGESVPGRWYESSWTWEKDVDGKKLQTQTIEVDRNAFLHLPLLLFRMPAPLKAVLIDFISNTFDCRVSPLALGTRALVRRLERWVSNSGQALKKDVLLTLGFHVESTKSKSRPLNRDSDAGGEDSQQPEALQLGLKTLDITIPAAEVPRFLRAGRAFGDQQSQMMTGKKRQVNATTTLSDEQKSRRRRKLAGGKYEEGWGWRRRAGEKEETEELEDVVDQPLTEALAAYLRHHLGLDLFHPGVRVQRIACDGFAISEGRLKVFGPPREQG
ncbi:hypothetical protein AAE478_001392 [Parahypoxylon ruwenzoriense]